VFYLFLKAAYLTILCLVFAIIYIIMPYTKVRFASALAGGIFAGTVYRLAEWAYIKFQIGVASYGDVYSNFAALPLFLAWLQISWIIVLLGVEVSYASERYVLYGFDPDFTKLSRRNRQALVILVLREIVQRFSNRETASGAREISARCAIPRRLADEIISELVITGLVSEVTGRRPGIVY